MKIIRTPEKKQILEKLKNEFGIQELPYLLLKFGEEKIRAYSGSLSTEELKKLDKTINIETVGIYFANITQDLRLSLDALHLLKTQISKNIIELTKEQADDWFKGLDLDIKTTKGFKILRFKDDFIGCGKSNSETIFNFLPKSRRIF